MAGTGRSIGRGSCSFTAQGDARANQPGSAHIRRKRGGVKMKRTPINSSRTARWRLPVAAACIGLACSISPALAESAIEADADSILRAMTDQLKGLKSFTADYDV